VGGFTELPNGDTIIEVTGSSLQDLGKLVEDQYYVTVSATVTIGNTEINQNGDTGKPLRPGFIATGPNQAVGGGAYGYSGVNVIGEVLYIDHTTDVKLPFVIPVDAGNGNTTKDKFDPLYGYNVRNITCGANRKASALAPGQTYEISGKVPIEVWSERSTYPGQAFMNLNSDLGGVTWILTDEDGNPQSDGYYHPLGVTYSDLKMTISNNSRMRPE
jgi:hypothetical protein